MSRHARAVAGVTAGACLISIGFGLAVLAALLAHHVSLALAIAAAGLVVVGAATVALFGVVYDADEAKPAPLASVSPLAPWADSR